MKKSCGISAGFLFGIVGGLFRKDAVHGNIPRLGRNRGGFLTFEGCGGYESVEALRQLEGKVDIYLPDLKYTDPNLGKTLSGAADYFDYATKAILEMYRQTGPYQLDADGMLQRGVLIRHLVLPGNPDNTRRVIDWVAQTFAPGQVLFSLMSQYTPFGDMPKPLNRRVTAAEYDELVSYALKLGVKNAFVQQRESASESFIPPFDT